MSIQNPIGNGPEDPYEKYKKYQVEAINKDKSKEGQKKKDEGEPAEKSLQSASFVAVLFHQVVDYLLRFVKHGIELQSEKEASKNLQALKSFFEIMKSEDRSQDIEFLNALSKIWHQALEDSIGFRRNSAFSIAFRSFVQKIQNYPENQEHTLGYYLFEYTGNTWLPFPYMELIQTIHKQYIKDPATSDLAVWIQEIDQLIDTVNSV